MSMLSKQRICLGLFLLINCLFSIKYFGRITPYYLVVAIFLSVVYVVVWECRSHFPAGGPLATGAQLIILIGVSAAAAVLFRHFSPETLNVDRWSVITSFWDAYFSGEYVYFAKSHMGNPPGPMPFYFMIALPFYLIGELGYFSLLGIFVYLAVTKYRPAGARSQTASLLLIALSMFYIWELVCRSNIFLNGALVLFSIVYFFRHVPGGVARLMVAAVMFGLLMSTRNVYAIPYAIAVLFALRRRRLTFRRLVLVALAALAVFAATFIPFVWGHIADFAVANPFVTQGSVLIPFSYVILFLAAALACGLLVRNEPDVYFCTGILLFVAAASHVWYKYTLENADISSMFFGNIADISYFILCVPFLLYSMIEFSPSELPAAVETRQPLEVL